MEYFSSSVSMVSKTRLEQLKDSSSILNAEMLK